MKFTQKYFWLIILLSTVIGFVWQAPGLILKNYLTPILMVMMTLSVLKIDLKELKNIKTDWWRYLIILINIFFVSSLLIYFVKDFFIKEIFLGLLIVTAVPCGISIVFFSVLFGGQPTKSLLTTTIAHLLAPILTPAIVWFFARQVIDVSFLAMFILIIKLIIIPIILAQIIRYFKWDNYIQKYVTSSNTLLLTLLNWGTVAPVAGIISANYNSLIKSIILVILIAVLQIIFGIIFGRNKEEDITWMIASFYRNTGLAAVITLTTFGTLATLGVMSYMIVTNVALAPLQWWAMRTKSATL